MNHGNLHPCLTGLRQFFIVPSAALRTLYAKGCDMSRFRWPQLQQCTLGLAGQVGLEDSHGFPMGLTFRLFPSYQSLGGFVNAQAGTGNEVQGPVQPPVSAAVDPHMLAGPALPRHRRRPTVAGEMVLGLEAPEVPHFGQQHASDDWADPRSCKSCGTRAWTCC
jgi:hypothetical protein